MRTALTLAVVGTVLAASALDLALGVLWVGALAAVVWLRRRIPLAAPLVLVASGALVAWGSHAGWLGRPAPAPYERGWTPAWTAPRTEPAPGDEPRVVAARERLRLRRQEELRLTGAELEQRAAALIALVRRLEPLRREAPRAVAGVETAVRRLARTLAAAEFRDLEARRAAAAAHLAELERRLGARPDATEAGAVLQAAEPAAMAQVSLRAVQSDLAEAYAAVAELVRHFGGGVPSTSAVATARYDEDRREIAWEVTHTLHGAPALRLLRMETRPFRAGVEGRPLSLAYAAGDEPMRPLPPGAWAVLDPAPRGASVVVAWAEPAAARAVRPALRPIAFTRLAVAPPRERDDALVVAVLDGRPELELPLLVRLDPPGLRRVTLPSHALLFASAPGSIAAGADGDAFGPTDAGTDRLELDLVPRTRLLRNPAFAAIRAYLYRPNPAAVAVAVGLGALTLVLVRRPRPPETK